MDLWGLIGWDGMILLVATAFALLIRWLVGRFPDAKEFPDP